MLGFKLIPVVLLAVATHAAEVTYHISYRRRGIDHVIQAFGNVPVTRVDDFIQNFKHWTGHRFSAYDNRRGTGIITSNLVMAEGIAGAQAMIREAKQYTEMHSY